MSSVYMMMANFIAMYLMLFFMSTVTAFKYFEVDNPLSSTLADYVAEYAVAYAKYQTFLSVSLPTHDLFVYGGARIMSILSMRPVYTVHLYDRVFAKVVRASSLVLSRLWDVYNRTNTLASFVYKNARTTNTIYRYYLQHFPVVDCPSQHQCYVVRDPLRFSDCRLTDMGYLMTMSERPITADCFCLCPDCTARPDAVCCDMIGSCGKSVMASFDGDDYCYALPKIRLSTPEYYVVNYTDVRDHSAVNESYVALCHAETRRYVTIPRPMYEIASRVPLSEFVVSLTSDHAVFLLSSYYRVREYLLRPVFDLYPVFLRAHSYVCDDALYELGVRFMFNVQVYPSFRGSCDYWYTSDDRNFSVCLSMLRRGVVCPDDLVLMRRDVTSFLPSDVHVVTALISNRTASFFFQDMINLVNYVFDRFIFRLNPVYLCQDLIVFFVMAIRRHLFSLADDENFFDVLVSKIFSVNNTYSLVFHDLYNTSTDFADAVIRRMIAEEPDAYYAAMSSDGGSQNVSMRVPRSTSFCWFSLSCWVTKTFRTLIFPFWRALQELLADMIKMVLDILLACVPLFEISVLHLIDYFDKLLELILHLLDIFAMLVTKVFIFLETKIFLSEYLILFSVLAWTFWNPYSALVVTFLSVLVFGYKRWFPSILLKILSSDFGGQGIFVMLLSFTPWTRQSCNDSGCRTTVGFGDVWNHTYDSPYSFGSVVYNTSFNCFLLEVLTNYSCSSNLY